MYCSMYCLFCIVLCIVCFVLFCVLFVLYCSMYCYMYCLFGIVLCIVCFVLFYVLFVWYCSMYCLFGIVLCIVCLVLFYVLFVCKCVLPPGDNPIAVNKYIISYQRVDGRLEPREELLWEDTRACGVVTCSFAIPASPTIIACEMDEKFRIQQRDTESGIS